MDTLEMFAGIFTCLTLLFLVIAILSGYVFFAWCTIISGVAGLITLIVLENQYYSKGK